jgi:hypothetical protein
VGLLPEAPNEIALAAWKYSLTLAFWNAYLKDDTKAKAWLQSDDAQKGSNGVATISRR